MEDREAFMALVAEVEEIAGTQGKPLSAAELEKYFADMHLDEKQIAALQMYFQEKRQQAQEIPEAESAAEPPGKGAESKFIALYKQDLEHIETSPEREEILVAALLAGDKSAVSEYVEMKLPLVFPLLDTYGERALRGMIPMEELLQEANLALVSAAASLDTVSGLSQAEEPCQKVWEYLVSCMEDAVRLCIDGESGAKDMETAVVAKTNLLYEAKKYLEEENGGFPPEIGELAEYTKMSEQEIRDILELTGKKGTM